MEKRGKIVVIEGTDGAGKGTQVAKLLLRAKSEGIDCTSYDFPRYDTYTGRGVGDYLNGKFGNAVSLPPKLSSALYALDRLDAAPQINYQINKKGRLVFMNRYIGSNFAHQAAKLSPEKRKEFVEWCKDYEYDHLGVPRPDLFLCLHVPAEESMKAVAQRGAEKDDHESNADYQKAVVDTYLWLAKNEPDWRLIDCMKDGGRKSIEEVTEEAWSHIKPILAN